MAERQKTSTNDVAVYVDYENLYISLRSTVRKNPDFDVILDKCREWGRVTIARAYADWSEFARVVTGQMFSSGIEPIYVPTRKFYDAKTRSQATKNAVDIHIAIDIIKDVLTTKNIDTFVLVSGDRDFVPLINQIRAAGKEIYAIGVAGCTSAELAVAVDGMFYYHQLLQSDEDLEKEQHDVYAKLVRAVEVARARGYRSTLGVVKPIMREVVAGFDEKKIRNPKGVPYAKFQDFVKDAEKNGFVKTTVTPGGGALEIWLAGDDPDQVRSQEEERDKAKQARGSSSGGGNGRRSRERRPSGRDEDAAPAAARTESRSAPEAEEDEGDDDEGRRRRTRRGSRGGRGRRRRSEEGGEPARAGSQEKAEELPAEVAAKADEAPAPRRVARTAKPPAVKRSAKAEAAEPEAGSDDGDAELAEDGEMVNLPEETADDLRTILDEFGSRVPSQRRLVARLKKAAADGELRGDYREGQFLLMVRKGLEEGWLEKVSKGFYSGLRWAGSETADSATAGS